MMTWTFRKRNLVIFLLVCVFLISVYMMFIGDFQKVVYEKKPEEGVEQVTATMAPNASADSKQSERDFFIDYKLERDRLRSQEADYLRELINNANATQESRAQAQKDLIALSQKVEKEMICENLIKAKGYEDAVIFLSNDHASVVIKAPGLQQKDIAQITDVVTKSTGIPIEKITIIERK